MIKYSLADWKLKHKCLPAASCSESFIQTSTGNWIKPIKKGSACSSWRLKYDIKSCSIYLCFYLFEISKANSFLWNYKSSVIKDSYADKTAKKLFYVSAYQTSSLASDFNRKGMWVMRSQNSISGTERLTKSRWNFRKICFDGWLKQFFLIACFDDLLNHLRALGGFS